MVILSVAKNLAANAVPHRFAAFFFEKKKIFHTFVGYKLLLE